MKYRIILILITLSISILPLSAQTAEQWDKNLEKALISDGEEWSFLPLGWSNEGLFAWIDQITEHADEYVTVGYGELMMIDPALAEQMLAEQGNPYDADPVFEIPMSRLYPDVPTEYTRTVFHVQDLVTDNTIISTILNAGMEGTPPAPLYLWDSRSNEYGYLTDLRVFRETMDHLDRITGLRPSPRLSMPLDGIRYDFISCRDDDGRMMVIACHEERGRKRIFLDEYGGYSTYEYIDIVAVYADIQHRRLALVAVPGGSEHNSDTGPFVIGCHMDYGYSKDFQDCMDLFR
jgi:hypothetical protein